VAAPSVLLLHSESDDREMYSEYLRLHGYAVTVAGSTDEALPLIPRADALLTGLMLPGSLDPVELIRQVRAELGNLPIVVVTASAFSDRIEQAHKAGADVVLLKPCFPDDLLSELQKAMDATTVRLVVPQDRRAGPDRRMASRGERRGTT
jgi:CheY-like chemotaxis protein